MTSLFPKYHWLKQRVSKYNNTEEGAGLAERIRKAVAETTHTKADPVTVSLGVAQFQAEESSEVLMRRADKALYSAKETGRDKVVVASEGRTDFLCA